MAIYKAYYSAKMNAILGDAFYLTLAPEGHEKEIVVSEVVRLDREPVCVAWEDLEFVGHVTKCTKPKPRGLMGLWPL